MSWIFISIFFILIMLVRFVINYFKFRRIKKLYKKYLKYLKERNIDFAEYKLEIQTLFKEANLKDSSVSHQEVISRQHFINSNASVFDNVTSTRADIVQIIKLKFNEATGVYKKRYKESYNPLFWIEFITKMPQYLMEFFGVLPEKIIVKVFLLIYWVIGVLFGLQKFDIINILLK